MPVAVVGGEEFLTVSVVAALRSVSPDVRAGIEDPATAERLRSMGARVAVSSPGDAETLHYVLSGAHTACVLTGLQLRPGETDVEAIADAVTRSRVRRTVVLSPAGASATSSNTVLRSAGRMEDLLAAAPACVVLRCSLVYGPGSLLLAALASLARRFLGAAVGPGTQALAPILADDVGRIVAAADDRASLGGGSHAVNGPSALSMDALADLLDRPRRRRHVTPGARLPPTGIPPPWLDILSRDLVADGSDASVALGVALTPLEEGLERATVHDAPMRPLER